VNKRENEEKAKMECSNRPIEGEVNGFSTKLKQRNLSLNSIKV